MNQVKNIILSELKSQIKLLLGDGLKNVILFGSMTDGNSNEYSDYDILVITSNVLGYDLRKNISDLCYTLELQYSIFIDLHLLSEFELDMPRGRQPVFLNAINSGQYA